MEQIVEELKKQAIKLAERNSCIETKDSEFRTNVLTQIAILKAVAIAEPMAALSGIQKQLTDFDSEIELLKRS